MSRQLVRKSLWVTRCRGYRSVNQTVTPFEYTLLGKYGVDRANQRVRRLLDDQQLMVDSVTPERHQFSMDAEKFFAESNEGDPFTVSVDEIRKVQDE